MLNFEKNLFYPVVRFHVGHNGHVKSMCFFLPWLTPSKEERGSREGIVPTQHFSWGNSGTAYAITWVLPSCQESVMKWQKVVVPLPPSTVQQHKGPRSAFCWCPWKRIDCAHFLWMCKVNSNRKCRLSQLQLSRRSSPNDVAAIIIMPHLMFSRRLSNDHLQHQQANEFMKIKLMCDLETSNFTYFICKLFPEDFINFLIKSLSFIENQFSVI